MKKTKKIISLLLTIQILFACTLVPSAMATDSVIELSVIGSESSEELSPMMARGCSSLERYLNQYSSQYGYVVNEIKYGSDVQLSNGYYYHAGQYGGSLMCFIYDSDKNCVQSSKI